MLDKLTSADFTPYLHRSFLLTAEVTTPQSASSRTIQLALELVEVSDLGSELAAVAPRSRAFSLVFCEPTGVHLPQHIYTVEHPTLGGMDIFLVPISHDRDGIRYQAVFT